MITFLYVWFASSLVAAFLHYLLVRNNPQD